jgi:hypothetical protein
MGVADRVPTNRQHKADAKQTFNFDKNSSST